MHLESESLEICICGGLYCSVDSLPIGFTLPHISLIHHYLGPLSCHRLGPPPTLTT